MSAAPTPSREFEWPTWLLWLGIWVSWALVVSHYASLPGWLSTPLLVVLLAWYMSLQHELTHGHPTRSPTLNRLLGLAPLAVWYPFDIYQIDHLKHHDDARLTEPGVDTESNYITAEQAAQRSAAALWLWSSQRTAVGRMLLGPGLVLWAMAGRLLRGLRDRDAAELRIWSLHLPLVALLLTVLHRYTAVPVGYYCLGIAYLAMGLAQLRSLYEHRPGELPEHRTVINEAAWPWRLLFLNNNYHVVHHAYPGIQWYKIPALYRADPAAYQARNGGFVLPGYGSLLLRHAFKPVDSGILAPRS